jgi:hypothetical protein
MKNQSKEQLSRSIERRSKHLMVQILEGFERRFDDMSESRDGRLFKADIRTACNDVIRATRDELGEYTVEYTPLRLDANNVLALTRQFLETVQKVEFGHDATPWIRFYAGEEHGRVLGAVRAEFGDGIVIEDDNGLVLEIVGLDSCVRSVLPIMDRYRFQPGVRDKYVTWRKGVEHAYRSQVNG